MTPKGTRFHHRGLGDTIAAVTKITRIDKVAKFVAKAAGEKDCGCGKRQESLNTRFPYKKNK
jgi:hypothetical protein